MKKICGFRSKNGEFYQKKRECELADLEYEFEQVKRLLGELDNSIQEVIFQTYYNYRHYIPHHVEEDIKSRICSNILRDSDKFIEIINRKKELSKVIDEYRKQIKVKNWINNLWWLKTKWW